MSLQQDFPGLRFHSAAIYAAAAKHGLDPFLVAAVVLQESAANTDGFRHERLFWNRYLKSKPEWASSNPRRVSSSYGLMQVMFPVAVERGMNRASPPEALFVPETGLDYGCLQLSYLAGKMLAQFPDSSAQDRLRATLASYNGGFQGPENLRPLNRAYADSVLRFYGRIKAESAV